MKTNRYAIAWRNSEGGGGKGVYYLSAITAEEAAGFVRGDWRHGVPEVLAVVQLDEGYMTFDEIIDATP